LYQKFQTEQFFQQKHIYRARLLNYAKEGKEFATFDEALAEKNQ
jgi:hypothetical protein